MQENVILVWRGLLLPTLVAAATYVATYMMGWTAWSGIVVLYLLTWAWAFRRATTGGRRRDLAALCVGASIALGTPFLFLPFPPGTTKTISTIGAFLDRPVEPLLLENVTISELCDALSERDIPVRPHFVGAERRVVFSVPRPTTNRDLLRRLRTATGFDLRLLTCAVGTPVYTYRGVLVILLVDKGAGDSDWP